MEAVDVELVVARNERDGRAERIAELSETLKVLKATRLLRRSLVARNGSSGEPLRSRSQAQRSEASKFRAFECVPSDDSKELEAARARVAEHENGKQLAKRLDSEIAAAEKRNAALESEIRALRSQPDSKQSLSNRVEALKRQNAHQKAALEGEAEKLVARRGELRRVLRSR